MSKVNRREFLKRTSAAAVVGGITATSGIKPVEAAVIKEQYGTLIDLTKCDGCTEYESPKCMEACKEKNIDKYPEPVEKIQPYWPQKIYEDWSDKREITNRLTPYNWIFVQRATVKKGNSEIEVFMPRRCMHCDNPPCATVCPFSANEKKPQGPVVINTDVCFGGAKCRDMCPWDIPQRQAGVGLYLKIAPKFAGGGVMYKCDLCFDLVKEGKKPACVESCPKDAMLFGTKETLKDEAYKRASTIGGFVYGDKENGGTSTYYISPVSFSDIDQALKREKSIPNMKPSIGNPMESVENIAKGLLIAPIASAFAAGIAAYRTVKGEE